MHEVDDPAILSARLNMATRAARIAVWEWDLFTDGLHWSAVFLQILGIAPAEFKGHVSDFIDRVVPEDRERVQRALQAHRQGDVPYDIEFQMFHRNGRRLVIAAQGQKVVDENDQPIRMVGTVQDITERRALEMRLLRAEQVARVGHWYLEVSKNELYWSPGTYLIHGVDPSLPQPDIVHALEYYHEEDRPRVAEALERVLATGEAEEVDARLVLADGDIRYVHVDGVAELSADGRPERVFGVVHDRTEVVKKEKELAHAHRLEAIGQLAGGVAHDFNNLMTVILGTLELLQEERPVSEEQAKIFEDAVHAVSQGRDLTQALLNFARSASLRPEIVTASEVLEEVHGVLKRTLPAWLSLKISPSQAEQSVFADRGNLEACLLNLVFNARDAIEGHGQITLSSRDVDVEAHGTAPEEPLAPGAYVAFEVRDDGKGIATEVLSRVFEPFFSTKAAGEGSGLGLSRVKGFAEQSGGAVRIESRVGEGTKVSIILPAAEAVHQESQTRAGAPDASELRPATVLLVEDLELVRKVMTVRLEREGHTVFPVADAQAALAAFEAHPEIDIVLSDVVVPGAMQGPDLVRELRSRRPGLPAVFMSGYSGAAIAQQHDIPQEDECLTKPVSRDELFRALGRALVTG